MAWDKGFDFRSTAAYLDSVGGDPANCTYVLAADSYSVTRNGVTFGYETAPNSHANRSTAVDLRLSGAALVCLNNVTPKSFRVDLPATGDYIITLALGDQATSRATKCVIKDDTTVLATINKTSTAANNYIDASGVVRTGADWPGSNVTITKTFATQILRLTFGANDTTSTANGIAHLFVSQVSSGGGFQAAWAGRSNRLIQPVGGW